MVIKIKDLHFVSPGFDSTFFCQTCPDPCLIFRDRHLDPELDPIRLDPFPELDPAFLDLFRIDPIFLGLDVTDRPDAAYPDPYLVAGLSPFSIKQINFTNFMNCQKKRF